MSQQRQSAFTIASSNNLNTIKNSTEPDKEESNFLEGIKFALIQMKDINTAYKIENQTAGQRE